VLPDGHFGSCRPRTAAAGGRPQAGLEVVEKLLTSISFNRLPMRS